MSEDRAYEEIQELLRERDALRAEVSALRATLRRFCLVVVYDKFMCRFCGDRKDRDLDVKHREGCPVLETSHEA